MPIDRLHKCWLVGICVVLSGCAERLGGLPYMGGPTNFGEANRQTMAAQIIDPAPTYTTLVPETSADHAAAAITRYRTDKVKQPVSPRQPTFGGAGAGAGTAPN